MGEPVTIEAADAARILQRRLTAKQRYRRRRDSKIAVDWLGREFDWSYRNMETGRVDRVKMRITRYNPENATMNFSTADGGSILWNTDSFWFLLRRGELIPA